ncbi:hypothetical protein [Guggenheimella bovis]
MSTIRSRIKETFFSRDLYLNLMNVLLLVICLWITSPESLYYKWGIWAGLLLLFLLLALVRNPRECMSVIFSRKILVVFIWPALLMVCWVLKLREIPLNYGAISLLLLLFWYYREIDGMGYVQTVGMILFVFWIEIAAVTIVMNILNPGISRDLALGRIGERNFRASTYLSNLHAVYLGVIMALYTLSRVLENKGRDRIFFGILTALLVGMVIAADYSFAIIILLIGLVLVLLRHFTHYEGKAFRTILIVAFSLLVLFMLLMAFDNPLSKAIIDLTYKYDMGTLNISEKLGNRLSVYLKSLSVYNYSPFVGLLGLGKGDWPIGNHSFLLDVFSQFGMIGFIVFILIHGYIYLATRKELREDKRALYDILMLVYSMECFVNPSFEVSYIVWIFLLIPALFMEKGKGARYVDFLR